MNDIILDDIVLNDTINQYINIITKDYDDVIFKKLLDHGFTKEFFIANHKKFSRNSILSDKDMEFFTYNGNAIFAIERITNINENKYEITYKVKDYDYRYQIGD